jgi:hypothetical protein
MKGRQITALFTLLAMLSAPLCAPLCHSHVCAASPSAAESDGCHNSSATADNARKISLKSAHTCGIQELPTAVLSETTNSPGFVKQQYAMHLSLSFVQTSSVLVVVSGAQSPCPDSESCIQSSSVQSAVLRI